MKTLTIAFVRSATFVAHAVTITALLIAAVPFHVQAANDLLDNRSVLLSDSAPGVTSNYVFGMTMSVTAQSVGSISLLFCTNSPVPEDPCTAPTGFDAAGATLNAQSGDIGFSIHPNSTTNRIILTRVASNPTNVASVYTFNNITNPTSGGSHYVRLQTFTADDATGTDHESGGVVFAIVPRFQVSAEVPPYIRFCASITIISFDCATATTFFIDMGTLSTGATSTASSQFLVATNAAFGYSVTLSGTTMTSGNNVIAALASPGGSSVGTSQFGLNLRDNSSPNVGQEVVGAGSAVAVPNYGTPNQFKFASGDTLVTSSAPDSNRKFTVSYITNISSSQAPGVYATTMTYICLANF